MDLEGRAVATYVTRNGFEELNFLLGMKGETDGILGVVRSADTIGLGVSLTEERRGQVWIIPWRYVRAIRLQFEAEPIAKMRRSVGFQP